MYLHKLIFQFKILVDKRTFTSAAESLFISQPTLTQNIQRLESALDVQLLTRNGRNISLTVYGESLYQHACLLDSNYRKALQDLELIKLNHRRTLVIECGHAWSHGVLLNMMKNYMQTYPEIRMVIKNSNTVVGQNNLLKGECDLALGAIPSAEERVSGINYIPVFNSRFVIFSSSDHHWIDKTNISRKELEQSDWVVLKHESTEEDFNDPLLCHISPEKIRFEVSSVSNAISLVKQSCCILALPIQLEPEARRQGLVSVNIADSLPEFQTGVMYIDSALRYEHKKAFIEALASSFLECNQ